MAKRKKKETEKKERESEIEQAYRDMRNAPNYTSYKDRKRHYERLLRKARREIGWKRDK